MISCLQADDQRQDSYSALMLTFIKCLADHIGERKNFFNCAIDLIDSTYEKTQAQFSNDFDVNFRLRIILNVCETFETSSCPVDYLHLRRKQDASEGAWDAFFDHSRTLKTKYI